MSLFVIFDSLEVNNGTTTELFKRKIFVLFSRFLVSVLGHCRWPYITRTDPSRPLAHPPATVSLAPILHARLKISQPTLVPAGRPCWSVVSCAATFFPRARTNARARTYRLLVLAVRTVTRCLMTHTVDLLHCLLNKPRVLCVVYTTVILRPSRVRTYFIVSKHWI
jgi:hypothetical protein